MGKAAAGTILMRFKTNSDHVVSAVNVSDDMKLLVVTRLGVGKRLEPELVGERKNRGGKGMMYYKPSDKTGEVVSVLPVDDSDTVFIGTQSNQVIRIRAIDIRETGRTGRGVQLIKLTDSDTIVSVAAAPEQSEDTSEGE
jgi:DNA gyrase subunit A